MPHTVEERTGGASTASFGPGPDMQIAGRVAVWEPPRRVVFDGGEGADGLVFEWVVEPGDAGTRVVRLVNTGFGEGEDGAALYEAMTDGWEMFLLDAPAPGTGTGTGFIAVEGRGDSVEVSIWSYLYGSAGAEAARRDEPRWGKWLMDCAPATA